MEHVKSESEEKSNASKIPKTKIKVDFQKTWSSTY